MAESSVNHKEDEGSSSVAVSPRPQPSPNHVLVLGLGDRGTRYARFIRENLREVKIVAACDCDTTKLAKFAEEHNIEDEDQFIEWQEALVNTREIASVVFICLPDGLHATTAIAAFELGYHVLLEKPIACTIESTAKVLSAAHAAGTVWMPGFVLRYTPFYMAVRQVVRSGVLGDIRNIDWRENVCRAHYAHSFVRGNWGNKKSSSPMILAKCCHDFDAIEWVTGKKIRTLSSFGSLEFYVKENAPKDASKRCFNCPHNQTCAWAAQRLYLTENTGWPTSTIAADMSLSARENALKIGPYGKCVFACDNDQVDSQVTSFIFEGGATGTLSMHGFSAEEQRTLRIDGTLATLMGNFAHTESLTLYIHPSASFDRHEGVDLPIRQPDGTGHGGGDGGLVRHFFGLIGEREQLGQGIDPVCTKDEVLESVLNDVKAKMTGIWQPKDYEFVEDIPKTSVSISSPRSSPQSYECEYAQSHILAFAAEHAKDNQSVVHVEKFAKKIWPIGKNKGYHSPLTMRPPKINGFSNWFTALAGTNKNGTGVSTDKQKPSVGDENNTTTTSPRKSGWAAPWTRRDTRQTSPRKSGGGTKSMTSKEMKDTAHGTLEAKPPAETETPPEIEPKIETPPAEAEASSPPPVDHAADMLKADEPVVGAEVIEEGASREQDVNKEEANEAVEGEILGVGETPTLGETEGLVKDTTAVPETVRSELPGQPETSEDGERPDSQEMSDNLEELSLGDAPKIEDAENVGDDHSDLMKMETEEAKDLLAEEGETERGDVSQRRSLENPQLGESELEMKENSEHKETGDLEHKETGGLEHKETGDLEHKETGGLEQKETGDRGVKEMGESEAEEMGEVNEESTRPNLQESQSLTANEEQVELSSRSVNHDMKGLGSAQVEDSAEIANQSSAEIEKEGSAEVVNQSSAEIEKEGSAEVVNQGSAEIEKEGSAEVASQGSAEIEKEGSAEVASQGSVEIEKEGSAEVASQGSVEIEKEGSAEVASQGSAEIANQSSVELEKGESVEVANQSSAEIEKEGSAELANQSSAEIEKEGSAEMIEKSSREAEEEAGSGPGDSPDASSELKSSVEASEGHEIKQGASLEEDVEREQGGMIPDSEPDSLDKVSEKGSVEIKQTTASSEFEPDISEEVGDADPLEKKEDSDDNMEEGGLEPKSSREMSEGDSAEMKGSSEMEISQQGGSTELKQEISLETEEDATGEFESNKSSSVEEEDEVALIEKEGSNGSEGHMNDKSEEEEASDQVKSEGNMDDDIKDRESSAADNGEIDGSSEEHEDSVEFESSGGKGATPIQKTDTTEGEGIEDQLTSEDHDDENSEEEKADISETRGISSEHSMVEV